MPVLLDTTVVIDCLRGRPAQDRVRLAAGSGDRLYSTPITVEEVARGLRKGEGDDVERFFNGVEVLPLRRQEGWQAGIWRREFAARGITLSQADCLIASAALSVGARLATGNPSHFPMTEIQVEHWPVGD